MATARATPADPIERAAVAFADTVRSLGLVDPAALGDASSLVHRAALLAAADWVWRDQVGPLLETSQAQTLLGVRSRRAVHDLLKRGRLIGLPTPRGRHLYPAFQF